MSRVLRTWLKFNTVGVIGIGVQLSVLGLLKSGLGVHYLIATTIAVECAVVHNFVWHERWTWRDRTRAVAEGLAGRLLRFQVMNGLISLVGNVGVMWILVAGMDVPYFAANVLAIGTCSLANFWASDRVVFQ